ncbi:MAG: hypothetical protein VX900_10950, partial [Pseudomonadota bacterium]|nr:hypothetical protein [Pseudomonadota bacterium]
MKRQSKICAPIRRAVMAVLCAVSVLSMVGVAPAEERQKSIFQPVLAKNGMVSAQEAVATRIGV